MSEHTFKQKRIFSKLSIRCGNIRSSCDRYILEVSSSKRAAFYVLVEEHEKIEYEGDLVVDASLKIKYSIDNFNIYSQRKINSNNFFGSYYSNNARGNHVSITEGAVFLDPEMYRGYKIGSYLMNVIVNWVQSFKNTPVNQIELLLGQSQEENKERRNRFWEQFGLSFDYDEERRSGLSKPICSHDLIQTENWKRCISKFSFLDVIAIISNTSEKNKELKQQIDNLEYIINHATSKPFLWAIKTSLTKLRMLLGI